MLVFCLKFLVSGPALYELVTCNLQTLLFKLNSLRYQAEISRIAERDLLEICVLCISYQIMGHFTH